jgi:hypothetical protein
MSTALKIRSGQKEFERGIDLHRICGFLTRRQYGKTTEAARIALKKMMRHAGHTVVFGSVKLDLGREIVRKESDQIGKAFRLAGDIARGEMMLQLADAQTGKEIPEATKATKGTQGFTADDFAELYEASRLEFRLYHSRVVYSRTKVVALTPEAVGETGDLILDEVGRVRKFREVWEAVKPIISSNPEFRCLLTTTPPPDDTHYSFELLAPPIGVEIPVSPKGNWYRSDLGVWVLRVTADDAYADGVMLYDDDTGAAISSEESRRRDPDKDAWDRNYGVKFVIGGSSACGLIEIDTAQRRGIGQCGFFQVSDDMDFDNGLAFLAKHLGDGPVGVGVDWASSQKEGTNPTSVTVTEGDGENDIQRVVMVWKASRPELQRERVRRVVETINSRPKGGRARRMAQDATGQQLFCRDVANELGSLVPVESVVMSETVELPSYDTPISKKTYLGDLYVARLNDNRLTLPPERYVREDHRMPKKIKGLYVCEPAPDGKHGDTFDSGKLASWALRSNAGSLTTMEGVAIGGNATRAIYLPSVMGQPLRR